MEHHDSCTGTPTGTRKLDARKVVACLALAAACLANAVVAADEVRYFECNGVTYREIKSSNPGAGSQGRWVVVTDYCWQPELVNRWNPFAQPYVVYRSVPRMRWELRAADGSVVSTSTTCLPPVATAPAAVDARPAASLPVERRPAPIDAQSLPGPVSAGSLGVSSPATQPPDAAWPRPASQGAWPSSTGKIPGLGVPPAVPQLVPSGGIGRVNKEPSRYGMRPSQGALSR